MIGEPVAATRERKHVVIQNNIQMVDKAICELEALCEAVCGNAPQAEKTECRNPGENTLANFMNETPSVLLGMRDRILKQVSVLRDSLL